MKKALLFAINVDWYFNLHWKERLKSKMAAGFVPHLCLSETNDTNDWRDFHFKKITLSRSTFGIWNNLKTFYGMLKVFRDVRPASVHAVTVKPNIMFGLLALVYNRPILITIPGLGSIFSIHGVKASVAQKFLLWLYRLVSINKRAFFIFENQADLAFFKEKGICSDLNATAVPGSGVDTLRFHFSSLKWKDDGRLQILFAGRLLEAKGLSDLVAAVADLNREGFPVDLNVAGIVDKDAIGAIPVAQVEKWHRQGKINWLGKIDRMERTITENHVVVLPTRYAEGLPRILLEANACGRPVIATDIPGCNDFVKNGWNGILIENGNREALKHAIKRMENREFSAILGKNGRQLVEQAYTSTHIIECYRNLYDIHLKR